MTKTTDDLIDRIQGAAQALKGVKAQLTATPAVPHSTVEVVSAPPPPKEVTQEDYNHAKQVIAEMKGALEQLEAEVSRDSKVPGEHEGKSKSDLPKAKV